MDEHHHWTVLYPGTDDELLVDANSPYRAEDSLIRVSDDPGLADRYELNPEFIMYNPADGAEMIAARSYPGLSEMVQQL